MTINILKKYQMPTKMYIGPGQGFLAKPHSKSTLARVLSATAGSRLHIYSLSLPLAITFSLYLISHTRLTR